MASSRRIAIDPGWSMAIDRRNRSRSSRAMCWGPVGDGTNIRSHTPPARSTHGVDARADQGLPAGKGMDRRPPEAHTDQRTPQGDFPATDDLASRWGDPVPHGRGRAERSASLSRADQDRRAVLDDERLPLRRELDPPRCVDWEGARASKAVLSDPCTVRATSEPACRDVRAIFSAASILARTASSAAPKATSVRCRGEGAIGSAFRSGPSRCTRIAEIANGLGARGRKD